MRISLLHLKLARSCCSNSVSCAPYARPRRSERMDDPLRQQIALALAHSLKFSSRVDPTAVPDFCFLKGQEADLKTGGTVCREIDLRGEEFYASQNYVMVIADGRLCVYRYRSADLRLKLYRKTDVCYLLYKIPTMRRSTRRFFYRIYLGLIESGAYRFDAWFEAIAAHLDIEQIESVAEYANGAAIRYRQGHTVFFNEYLARVSEDSLVPRSPLPESEGMYAKVGKSSVALHKRGSSYTRKLKIKGIRQHVAVADKLFLLTDDKLVVVQFV
ncbi:hypothetical protein PAPHI01_1011 [Pancytospora philotis]|nr:hypothetical protein PAPHI01_1011 [Pancytospora philotis]